MRMNRRRYIVWQVILLPLGWAVFGFLALAIWTLDHTFAEHDIPQPLRAIALSPSLAQLVAVGCGVVAVALVVALILVSVRRLHDIGMSGWFLLLWPVLITLIETSSDKTGGVTAMSQVALEAILMMVPGQGGANAYGPEPLPPAL